MINCWIKIYENSNTKKKLLYQNKNEIILIKESKKNIKNAKKTMIISLIFSLFTKNEITVRGVNRSILPKLGSVTGEFYGVDREWKFETSQYRLLDEGDGRKTRPSACRRIDLRNIAFGCRSRQEVGQDQQSRMK